MKFWVNQKKMPTTTKTSEQIPKRQHLGRLLPRLSLSAFSLTLKLHSNTKGHTTSTITTQTLQRNHQLDSNIWKLHFSHLNKRGRIVFGIGLVLTFASLSLLQHIRRFPLAPNRKPTNTPQSNHSKKIWKSKFQDQVFLKNKKVEIIGFWIFYS